MKFKTLTLSQIIAVLYRGRTAVNFGHVPEVSRAIDWLSMEFRDLLEDDNAAKK